MLARAKAVASASHSACSASADRFAAASCERAPWVHRARRLRASPSGVFGPVLSPPCIRQRFFPRTAGARQG